MGRLDRVLWAVLGLVGVVLGANTLVAVDDWMTTWRAFNELGMALTTVEVGEGTEAVLVGLQLSNGSETPIQIMEIESWVQLNGHTVAGGKVRYADDYLLPGGVTQEVTIRNPLYGRERSWVLEQPTDTAWRWNISGRARVRVEGHGDPMWVPYVGAVSDAPGT